MNETPEDADLASSLDDVAFLARSGHRVGILAELADGPGDRADLRVATGASSPTVGRILSAFEDRRWVVRDGSTFELTTLGSFVADRFLGLCGSMATERKLRDVWRWLPREMPDFSVELFADAVVSYPGPGYPYEPIERVAQLIGETGSMRGFGATVLKSANLEAACRSIDDGLDFEYVYSPVVYEAVVAWNPDRIAEVAARENCTTLLHDSLPDADRCGLIAFDDRVSICCHDGETGALRAVVDTDAPEARAWATALYDEIRDEARPPADDDGAVPTDRGE